MTKNEVLAEVRARCGEIRAIVAALEYDVLALTQGYRLETEGDIDSLSQMMDTLISKADDVKSSLSGWPG